MITNSDITDVYGSGLSGIRSFLKSAAKAPAKVTKAAYSGVKALPGASLKLGAATGRLALTPSLAVTNLGVGISKGLVNMTGKVAGTALGLPIGLLRATGSGVASGFKSSAGGGGSTSSKNADTARAASEVMAQQQGGYTTSPAGGYSGGAGADSGVGLSQGTLTADPNAAPDQNAAAGPVGFWAGLSPTAKMALVAAVGGVSFLGYKALNRRGGGTRRRTKS